MILFTKIVGGKPIYSLRVGRWFIHSTCLVLRMQIDLYMSDFLKICDRVNSDLVKDFTITKMSSSDYTCETNGD